MAELFASGEHDVSSVRRILCGGAEAPPSLIAHYTRRGIDFFHGWGMTEMSPSGSGAWIRAADTAGVIDGRPGPATAGVELRVVGDDGSELDWDGRSAGELQARGPWVAAAYLRPDDDANETRFDAGWLRTGDVARLASDGTVEIVDRAKDLVKSGGEWISSVELERELMAHPAIREAAVIALPHERWGERPLACIVLQPGTSLHPDEVAAFLRARVASWWIPERIEFVADLPKTGVGKLDKRRIRAEHGL
jgi:fatty-acyl-CoA synthase